MLQRSSSAYCNRVIIAGSCARPADFALSQASSIHRGNPSGNGFPGCWRAHPERDRSYCLFPQDFRRVLQDLGGVEAHLGGGCAVGHQHHQAARLARAGPRFCDECFPDHIIPGGAQQSGRGPPTPADLRHQPIDDFLDSLRLTARSVLLLREVLGAAACARLISGRSIGTEPGPVRAHTIALSQPTLSFITAVFTTRCLPIRLSSAFRQVEPHLLGRL